LDKISENVASSMLMIREQTSPRMINCSIKWKNTLLFEADSSKMAIKILMFALMTSKLGSNKTTQLSDRPTLKKKANSNKEM
jgi:hypothetical protein